MGVFSRYKQVIEADGTPMTVRSALQIINQELDKHLNEQLGTMESITGFCLALYEQKAFNTIPFGDADTLARARNTSVEEMKKLGVLCSSKGIVSLMVREDLQPFSTTSDNLWLITQQAVRAFEVTGFDGAASVLSQVEPVKVGKVKSLCYQLFSIADKKGWASEAYAYNNLIASWDDTLSISSVKRLHANTVQAELDFEEE
jgi:putative DNA methylase